MTRHKDLTKHKLAAIQFLHLLLFGLCLACARVVAAPYEPIQPLPPAPQLPPAKVALGQALFHDPLLSADHSVACASCHHLGEGGADTGKAVSVGIQQRPGKINTPTVYNAALQFRQFWDGRAATLADQIDGPLTAEWEMGNQWPKVLADLYGHPNYPERFNAVYGDGITRANVKDALQAFQQTLITRNAPFDRYLQGDQQAISAEAKRGYELFKKYGCASCHQGVNVGGNMFQVFGVINNYFKVRGHITEADLGRFNITGNAADRHAFKVPSLRMAKYTAPYLHDGSQATLAEAVNVMFKYQLGREAPEADKAAIVRFIETLAGDHPELINQ